MPEMQTNAFKRAIAQGKLQIGLWSSLCSNIAAEVISDSGFDWILLDTEHSPNEIPDLVTQLQAVQRGTATPIIRPAWNDAVMAKRALDIAATQGRFTIFSVVDALTRMAGEIANAGDRSELDSKASRLLALAKAPAPPWLDLEPVLGGRG